MEQIIKGIEAFNGEIINESRDGLVVKSSDDCREDFIIYVIMKEFFSDVIKENNKIIGQCLKGDPDPY